MRLSIRLLLVSTTAAAGAWAQPSGREPRIGYVYPAGGRRGSTFEILVGGQYLRGVTDVYVSGTGVRASVVQHYRPLKNLQKEQREALQERLRQAFEKRLEEWSREGHPLPPAAREFLKNQRFGRPKSAGNRTAQTKPADLPEHPLLRNLDRKSLRELLHVRNELLSFKKRQPNMQIAESVLIEVTIAAGAAPGIRDIRLGTAAGLTNPLRFEVGVLPEAREQEPNDPQFADLLPPEPPAELPVVVNGQITPGDVDRFSFEARRGQQLVIETRARQLIPYLADAVPGWFQATVALYDPKGAEVAFADDYRFEPDPVLFYQVPQDGTYELEIRDSIYRGREDFVYRISVGEDPFITQVFPLGGRTGTRTVASIEGWNLPKDELLLATPPGIGGIRQTVLRQKQHLSNPVSYVVNRLPECNETEPNNSAEHAQELELPRIVNGRIGRPGDVDVFRFQGRSGSEIVAEVMARRLYSPLDSVLRLTDASGKVLEWNDDHDDQESGLLTHHADSYLRARLPEDGVYYVHLADTQHHGSDAHAYRLRVGAPQPDFALRLTPSSVNLRPGGSAAVCIHVARKDGFEGPIDVALVKDAAAGFTLSGGRLPSGRGQIRMTLTAPREPLDKPVVLELEGRARIGGQTVRHPVVPAEDLMQAFFYRHLAPSQQLMASTRGGRGGPPIELAGESPVRVPVGGTARVRMRCPRNPRLADIQLELRDPPEGMSLQKVTAAPDGLAFLVKADHNTAKVGLADNLILEAFARPAARQQAGKGRPNQRFSLGMLPAIPFEVVDR